MRRQRLAASTSTTDPRPVLGEKTAVVVMQALLDALADPFTEVEFERYPKNVCPLCGGTVAPPTKTRPTYKCRDRVDHDQTCNWAGKEPAKELHLTIRATTRGA